MAGDPYQELGVSRTATADEIRKAFRRLAKDLHPDRNPGDKAAEERFKRITAAFDLLGDAEKRARFDRGEIDADGRETFRGFGGGAQGGGFGGRPGGGFGGRFEGVDLDDIFDLFGGVGGNGRRPGAALRGADLKARLEVSLEDTIRGATRRIAFSDGRTLDVTVPKGAQAGQTLRLKGQGAPGRGGPPGDALIELVVAPHPVFRREGADLMMDLPVSLADAVLGGKVQAPTPEGPVTVTVPKGANSGTQLRLKGRGAYAEGRRGDLLARVMISLPDPMEPDLVALAEAWRSRAER